MNAIVSRWYRITIMPANRNVYETAVRADCYEKALTHAAEQAARMKLDPLTTNFNVRLFDRVNLLEGA